MYRYLIFSLYLLFCPTNVSFVRSETIFVLFTTKLLGARHIASHIVGTEINLLHNWLDRGSWDVASTVSTLFWASCLPSGGPFVAFSFSWLFSGSLCTAVIIYLCDRLGLRSQTGTVIPESWWDNRDQNSNPALTTSASRSPWVVTGALNCKPGWAEEARAATWEPVLRLGIRASVSASKLVVWSKMHVRFGAGSVI